MHRKSLYLLIIMIAAFVAAACNSAPEAQEGEAVGEALPTIQAPTSGDTVRVGVLAIRSAVAANAQYGPIMEYLEAEIGRPFELVPLDQATQFTEVEAGNLDFTFNNPLAAVQIQRLYDTEFLATLSRINTGPEFSAVIVVAKDSGIETVEDLRGKNGTCVNFETAAAGCVFQTMHLIENGVNPHTDFASFTETPSQDNIVLGVLNGSHDVGFIRTGQLEKMVREGLLLSMDEVQILDQADDDFFFPHTTRLYPEWPMAALSGTDPELKAQVQAALLKLEASHPAMENAGAVGFEEGIDYSSLHNLVETLELRSWDAE